MLRSALVAAYACAPPPVVPLPKTWADGSVVVAVELQGDAPTKAAVFAPDVAAAGLPAHEGSVVVAFAIPTGGFSDETGLALEAARFADLAVRTGPPSGGCGRCLGQAPAAPEVVRNGDACPPPRFAEASAYRVDRGDLVPASLDAETIERVRRSITLEWPGACACAPRDLAPPIEGALRMLSPSEALPIDVVAGSPEGSVLVAGEHVLARADGSGALSERPPPFRGRILAAAGLDGDRFLVASHAPYALRDTRYDLFDRDLGIVWSSEDQILHRPERIRPLADRIVMAGRSNPQTASLMICDVGATGLGCRELLTSSLAEPYMVDAALTSSGLLAGLGTLGRWLVFDGVPSPAGGPVRSRELPPIAPGIGYTSALGALGDRLFACATTDYQVILTTTVGASIFDPGAPPPAWRTVHCAAARCNDLVATSSGTMRAELDGGRIVELGAGGEPVLGRSAGCSDPVSPYDGPELGRPMRARHIIGAGEAILTADDAVLLRSGTRLARIHGLEQPVLGHVTVVASGSTFYGLPPYGETIPLVEGSGVELLPSAIAEDEIATGAVMDDASDRIVAVGTCKVGCSSWARFVRTDGSVEPIPLPEGFADRLGSVASAALDTFVAAGSTSLVVIRGGRAAEVTIDWRGPASACGAGMVVSGAQGVAYAGACAGVILRVFPFSDPPRAERIEVLEPDPILFDPLQHATPPIGAIRAFCADDVLFGARAAGGDAEEEAGWIWELRAGVLEAYRGNASAALARRSSGAPVSFLGPPERPVVVSSDRPARHGSIHRFGSRTRSFFGASFESAAIDANGSIRIGASYGRMLAFD